uniref:Differentially expressed in FDCP 8 homolog n=1 Tax=Cacopsylla melanoneura TaxID=428564 RepID=A0A8D9BY40_9HEMI
MTSLAQYIPSEDTTLSRVLQDKIATMSNTVSPSSSDGGISEDLSYEEVAPEGVHFEDIRNLNSKEDIEDAIAKFKEMILETEGCSNDRKWLVRSMIELRYKLELLKENENQSLQEQPNEIFHSGHNFLLTKFVASAKSSQLKTCDVCCGSVTLLGLLMPWYECSGCHYVVHIKCVSATRRTCVCVKAAEQPGYVLNICPEITLLEQKYKCVECRAPIIYNSSVLQSSSSSSLGSLACLSSVCETSDSDNDWANPRLCDYDGRHYCTSCHWQDTAIIPARVLHHWDFTRYPVCRSSFQLLNIMQRRPILDLTAINPSLFGFIEDLAKVKKYREDLLLMKPYLITCRVALEMNLLWGALEDRQTLAKYPSHVYSLRDLIHVKSGTLIPFLESVLSLFRQHIKYDCKVCFGRGFMCELCIGKTRIFPFDESVHLCDVCHAVYHKHCWLHKHVCTKCERINKRAQITTTTSEIESEQSDVPDQTDSKVELEEAVEMGEEILLE